MIHPQPKHEAYFDGKYKMKAYSDTQDLMKLYDMYKQGNEDVKLELNLTYDEDKHDIYIDADGIRIVYGKPSGIFRAVSSLKQMFKEYGAELPYCEIKDEPDFKKRGYMLDISRCRMPKLELYTKLIDLLADLKYNEFQIYMESFVFKYSAYPKYTEDFDCLTPEDIIYLDKYCKDRFIELVPNQNGFGHMATWLNEDEFKHLDVSGGEVNTATINPLLPESFELMDNLYGSLLPYFTSEYINIGLDEAGGLGKYALEDICNEIGPENVFMDWLNKLADHLRIKYGKKVQFWSDMIYEYPDAYKRMPKDAIALNWGYDLIKSAMIEERSMALEERGARYYICPGNCTWLSLTGRFDVMSFNLRTCGEVGVRHGAEGYLLTDWGCGEGHMHHPIWSLVPAALAAQYAWNIGVKQNGGMLKPDFIRASEKYIDENVFGGAKVSNWLYKMQQYYLLEPERLHSSTMSCFLFQKPLNETEIPHFFDLKVCGDDFYFENVIDYMNKAIEGLKKVEFDSLWKRQALNNAYMVILGAEQCMIRMHQIATNEKIDELAKLTDDICAEYTAIWDELNFPKGKEHFLDQLQARKQEMLALKK